MDNYDDKVLKELRLMTVIQPFHIPDAIQKLVYLCGKQEEELKDLRRIVQQITGSVKLNK